MKPPNRRNACWDSLDARVRPTSARLSPARKTHPKTLLIGAVIVPAVSYLLAYAGLGFPPALLSADVVAAALVLLMAGGVPIFVSVFLRGVFHTTVTVYPGEGVACKSWGPYYMRLWRKWVPVGDGPWRIVPATILEESAALHDAMSNLRSGSATAMLSGFQDMVKADEELGVIDHPVWGVAGADPEAPGTRAVAWFLCEDDAQIALLAIVQAGGSAIAAEQPQDLPSAAEETEAAVLDG